MGRSRACQSVINLGKSLKICMPSGAISRILGQKIKMELVLGRMKPPRCGKKYFAHTRGSGDEACEVKGPDRWLYSDISRFKHVKMVGKDSCTHPARVAKSRIWRQKLK